MKKVLISIVLIFVCVFTFSDYLKDCSKALNESNKLLQQSLVYIEKVEAEKVELEKKVASLEKEIEAWKEIAEEAGEALTSSNEVLKRASDRIDADQKEIEDLRLRMRDLLKVGFEPAVYHWSLMFYGGYPANIGLAASYNLHFLPKIGLMVGFNYNFEVNAPTMLAGIKINLE